MDEEANRESAPSTFRGEGAFFRRGTYIYNCSYRNVIQPATGDPTTTL